MRLNQGFSEEARKVFSALWRTFRFLERFDLSGLGLDGMAQAPGWADIGHGIELGSGHQLVVGYNNPVESRLGEVRRENPINLEVGYTVSPNGAHHVAWTLVLKCEQVFREKIGWHLLSAFSASSVLSRIGRIFTPRSQAAKSGSLRLRSFVFKSPWIDHPVRNQVSGLMAVRLARSLSACPRPPPPSLHSSPLCQMIAAPR